MASVNRENRRGSGKNVRVHFELPEDEDHQITPQRYSSSPISSSDSDSESSQESDAISKEDQSIRTLESNHASTRYSSSTFSTEFNYPSPVWSFQSGSFMQSSQMPVMGRAPGYDPNRIPLSIFCNKSANPADWSVTSNESLFSLQIGNNSFSRDWKSGEFPSSMALSSVEEKVQSKGVEIERHSVSSESSQDSVNVENNSKLISEESLSPVEEEVQSKDVEIGRHSVSSEESLNVENHSILISKGSLSPVEEIVQSKDAETVKHSVPTESSRESVNVENPNKFTSNESSEQSPNVIIEKHSELRENSAETAIVLLHQTPEDHYKEATVLSEEARSSISVSHRSASTVSNTSFQFPILATRASPTTTESEKQQPETPSKPPSPKTETQRQKQPKPGVLSWFNCFSCCSPCY